MTYPFKRHLVALTIAALATGGAALMASGAGSAAGAAKPSIIWLEQGAGNPYWSAQHAAAAVAGNRLGFTFKAVSGNANPQDQANIMHQLVDQHPAVIMLNAIDPKAMVPALNYAKSKGVKVLNLYGIASQATASVTFDELRTGRIAAKIVLGLLKKRYGSAKGEVAVLSGVSGQPASDQRAQGFTNYMKTQPNVKVDAVQPTNWLPATASSAMQDFLVKYPNLGFVFTLSDTLALPAANIAQRQGKLCTQQANWAKNSSCVGFVSADGIFAQDVQSGKFFATELYSPQWSGYVYAQLAHDLAVNKTVPSVTKINSFLIEPQNARCALKMINDMTNHMATFPFGPSLQQIAQAKYHCAVLDRNL